MVCRFAILVLVLSATPLCAQVATPTTAPPPRLTIAQLGLFVYPAKGQSPAQQKRDEDACYAWAETNTGMTVVAGSVDTQAAAKESAREAGQGKVAQGAATGAATGVAVGAITGNVGKGVAPGAVAGSVRGLRGRIKSKQAAGQAGAQQVLQANQQGVDQFKKAASACLDARGYAVK